MTSSLDQSISKANTLHCTHKTRYCHQIVLKIDLYNKYGLQEKHDHDKINFSIAKI